MIVSKQALVTLTKDSGFIKDNLEKVLRLREILKFLNSDPVFKNKLALKGGTAINLTVVNFPRLSVDIDLDFTQNLSKEEIAEQKEILKSRLFDYMNQEGYLTTFNDRLHYALLSLIFSYTNNAGNKDNIKVEINFMDRCHILPIRLKQIKTHGVLDELNICVLDEIELYASKINALISRATPRDLYDVNKMIEKGVISDKCLLKKCLVFYNMIGGNQDIENLNYDKIQNISHYAIKTQLKPVLSKTDSFNLEDAKATVIEYLKNLIVLTNEELEFIREFKNKNYKPHLLFEDEQILTNISNHPMALWRCR